MEGGIKLRTNLKKERDKKNITQEKLAEFLSISEITVRSLENGSRNPSTKMAKKYALFFGKSLDYLFPDVFLILNDTKCIEKGEVS